MATLSENPTDLALEDFVAAHFSSRGVFVETGVTERDPEDILELDIVWTDYRSGNNGQPVEIKSGHWGLTELFKFFGWTRYLGLDPGQFVFLEWPARASVQLYQNRVDRLGISLVHLDNLQNIEPHFSGLGLPALSAPFLPEVWRYSFWAQRRFFSCFQSSIRLNHGGESATVAKEYFKLVNDAIFFTPDIRNRVGLLLKAHFEHPSLALTAANEIAGRGLNLLTPTPCDEFTEALYAGKHLPIQACMYLSHRARLAILKAAIDYSFAKASGNLPRRVLKIGSSHEIDFSDAELPASFLAAVSSLSRCKSFHMFATFWQVFLWGWGGFILTDRLDDEYRRLSEQTGVPVDDIPVALTAFDELFPISNGWFRQPQNDSRRLVQQMPAAMRGVGAYHRLLSHGVDTYSALGFSDYTVGRLQSDHNVAVRLLDCDPDELIR